MYPIDATPLFSSPSFTPTILLIEPVGSRRGANNRGERDVHPTCTQTPAVRSPATKQ